MSFWFLHGIFSQTREATFIGGIEKISRIGLEIKVTSKCRGNKVAKSEA